MLVKDYRGKLIPREKARQITGDTGVKAYYEIGVSCIKMNDGKWYRTTTGKIIYDHSLKKWVFSKGFTGSYGLLADGSAGHYSDKKREIQVLLKSKTVVKTTEFDPISKDLVVVSQNVSSGSKWSKANCINAETAEKLGYQESIYDGNYYKLTDCDVLDLDRMKTPNIPPSEKNNIYSLDDDIDGRRMLEQLYEENDIPLEKDLRIIAKRYLPYSFGLENEVQNGFVPARVREPLGFRVCRDGSLDGGIEFVSIPMEEAKGLQAIKNMCKELTKRTTISNKCSVHLHYGDVRRDRLYFLSLWQLLYKIQAEFRTYFPYSRTNSIREDGKIYAAMLPNLSLSTASLLKIGDDEKFKTELTKQWATIYTYLNSGHPPGEVIDEEFVKATRETLIKGKVQKQFSYRVQKTNYTTKLPRHAIQGHKWQRPTRYMWVNFLNLFFAHSKTVEFRISEATTSFDKILLLMLTYTAILKYAENFNATLSTDKVTVNEVLHAYYPAKLATQIMTYWLNRKNTFSPEGTFSKSWKSIEAAYMAADKTFTNKLEIE